MSQIRLRAQCTSKLRREKYSYQEIMLIVILMSALLAVTSADNPKDDAQYMNLQLKGTKGGGGSYVYRGGENANRFFNHTQHGYVVASQTNHEVGVCYIEVPTSSLVRDPKHIPAGNGSRPELSRIRTCCTGYIRNIHNYLICDPVCTNECINALCTAPETCTCFPDHVKNIGGFCVATCPIGCQNGHCNGAQCLCKEGFKLDGSGRFCVPYCRDNCGGTGNCTAPNTCGHPGQYPSQTVPQYPGGPLPGSNQVVPGSQPCGSCLNGYCAGSECRCRPGYLLYRGECKALCNPNCEPGKDCVAPNVCAPKGTGANSTHVQNNGINNNPQYPYPNPLQTPYQNPNQYPGQHPQNQYPYPNGQNPNNPQHNQQYPNSHNQSGHQQPNPIYAPYPGQQNQNPGQQNQYPGQQNQYPGQQNQYTYPGQQNQYPHSNPSQLNGTNSGYPTQHPQPGHQHLYPRLPSDYPNNLPTSQGVNGTGLRTDGQVFYQNRPYNPLENATFNLQQGSDQTTGSHNGTQGHYIGGQNSQGQFGQGQFGQGQYSQGQFGQGQYSQGQFHQDQYSQGQYNQGQYNQGQHNQGQYGQGHYQQGYYPYPGQGPYGQNVPDNQQGQISSNGFGNCEQPCVNGNCIGHNRCECLPGYNPDPADSTGNRCIPYCHGGCLNGFCASPNNCVCSEGYHKDFSVKGRSGCVKRVRRSAEPLNIADLLVFEIPDTE